MNTIPKGLYCFSCNENYAACRYPFVDMPGLENNYIKCNGQCMKFRNPNDNYCKYFYIVYKVFKYQVIMAFLKYGIVDVQMKDSTQNSSHQFFSTREQYISSAIKMGMNHIFFIYL